VAGACTEGKGIDTAARAGHESLGEYRSRDSHLQLWRRAYALLQLPTICMTQSFARLTFLRFGRLQSATVATPVPGAAIACWSPYGLWRVSVPSALPHCY
jgi:hypothetical protein